MAAGRHIETRSKNLDTLAHLAKLFTIAAFYLFPEAYLGQITKNILKIYLPTVISRQDALTCF